MGYTIRTWFAVCSEVPHSEFDEGVRLHLCMDEWNHPTPVLRQLSLTQALRDKHIPTGLALILGIKTQPGSILTALPFHLWFFHSEAQMPSPTRLFKRFIAAGTNGHLDQWFSTFFIPWPTLPSKVT